MIKIIIWIEILNVKILKCSSLLATEAQKDEFLEFVNEEYEEIRADYFENIKEKKYLPLAESRKRNLNIDWDSFTPRKYIY